jgi:hypothetical protein
MYVKCGISRVSCLRCIWCSLIIDFEYYSFVSEAGVVVVVVGNR